MEPFIVSCGSCHSRIRIRNSRLVGQRVSCPKCGSEVTVVSAAPPKIHVGHDDSPQVDSTALTQEGLPASFGDSTGTIQSSADKPLEEDPSEAVAFSNFDFSEVEDVLSQQEKNSALIEPAEASNYWQVPERTPQRAAPSQQWSSQSTARSRQYLIIGFLGLSGCILAVLLFAFFLKWYSKDNSPIPKLQEINKDLLANAGDDVEKKELDAESQVVSSQASDATTEADVPNTTVQPTQLELEHPVEPETHSKPSPQSDTLPNSQTDQAEQTDPGNTSEIDVPPQIAALLKIIGEPEAINEPPKLIIPDKPAVTDNEINTGISAATMTPIPRLMESANERQLRGLRLTQKTLPEILSIWNSLVGLPVVVDPRALAAADYDLQARFDLEMENITAASAIDKLATTVGLKAESQENRFWLLKATVADEGKLPWSVQADDLVKSPQEQTWLFETLELMYPGSSSALSFSDGKLIGKAESLDRLNWFSIVRLLENWRMQEGRPPNLSGYRRGNLRVPFVTAGLVPQLQQGLNEITATPKTLASLLNHQATSVGLTCWVDWPALAYLPVRLSSPPKAISPQTLRVSITNNRPFINMLNELDFELGIACLIINENTLWLTSHVAYRRVPEVFVIPSQGKPLDSYWSQLLRPLTPIDSSGISQVILQQTPDGKYVIAKCCWPTLQFE